jgi:hypothetical protein
VRDTVNMQRVAFGQPPLPDDEAPGDQRTRGGGIVVARLPGGEIASAAVWTAVIDGTSEVAGVATAEPHRRRLAGVVTAAAAPLPQHKGRDYSPALTASILREAGFDR